MLGSSLAMPLEDLMKPTTNADFSKAVNTHRKKASEFLILHGEKQASSEYPLSLSSFPPSPMLCCAPPCGPLPASLCFYCAAVLLGNPRPGTASTNMRTAHTPCCPETHH